MNAAYLLLTSAWMAGADAAPNTTPPANHPPAVVSTGSSCISGGCGTASCDSCGHAKEGLFSKLRGKFGSWKSKKSCDSCEPCPTPVVCAPAPTTICKPEPACKPAPTCDSCSTDFKNGLFNKIRGKFSKHSSGSCEASCDPCATGTPTQPAPEPKKMEPAPTPKKMPDKDKIGSTTPILTPTSSKSPIQINSNPF